MANPRALRPTLARPSRRAGTSLVEILVVIVVFLIGILAIVQIFPGGFKILARTRDLSIGEAIGRDLSERLKGRADELPQMILPLSETGAVDPTRFPTDTSIYGEGSPGFSLNPDGTITVGGTNYGDYAAYAGPNVFRQIIGESQTIPDPRPVGAYFGGLMVLNFGPLRDMPGDQPPVTVYGNEYEVQVGAPPQGILPNGQAYIDDPNSPTGTLVATVDDPTTNPEFRLSCTIYTTKAGAVLRHDILGMIVPNAGIGTFNGNYLTIQLAQLAAGYAGEAYGSVDPASVRLERVFESLPPASTFSGTDPYQYKVLNARFGVLLFNPAGYNYLIQRGDGAREPLRAQVDYVVQDWRIIGDEVRLDDSELNYRLSFDQIKALNNVYQDGLAYKGFGQGPLASGALANVDVVFLDVLTGGILIYDPSNPTTTGGTAVNDVDVDGTKSSFYVNKSRGVFRVVDGDAGTAGNQVLLALPDPTTASGYATPISVNANGRPVRVMYMAAGNWTVQPLAAASSYAQTSVMPPAAAQYFVGTGARPRLYFPNMDVGNKVSADLIYYQYYNANDPSKTIYTDALESQTGVVRDVPADPNGAYVDLADMMTDPNRVIVGFDYSHGFAVRGVRGVSVTVRVSNNPTGFSLGANLGNNLSAFDAWRGSWRSETTDTFVQRGGGY